MRLLFFIFLFSSMYSVAVIDDKKNKLKEDFESFYDPTYDYSRFIGRVTDKDKTGHVLKIQSETKNIRFLKIGDLLFFKVGQNTDRDYCRSQVRDSEKDYIVVYVEDFSPCWYPKKYFRRGNKLEFYSPKLSSRIRDASLYRALLLRRKKDFFGQLNEVNHFVWTYDQEKIKLAATYDDRINKLIVEKQEAIDSLLTKKEDYLKLQRELSTRLGILDKDLEFYRIDREELFIDRWNKDHHLGLPVKKRPQDFKVIE